MTRPTRDPSVVWAGIPSNNYRVHAFGRDRITFVDALAGRVWMDMGDSSGLSELTGEHVTQALDLVRATLPDSGRPDPDADEETLAELRAENERGYAERGIWHSCVFDWLSDPSGIPDGADCGGCACHLSAPCHHCMAHLPNEDAEHIATMLDLTGRSTT